MLDWLLSPIDAARGHDIGILLSWHARLMVLAWAILVPAGILAARFFKILPGQDWPAEIDNRLWWRTHRICQYSAAALMIVALLLILNAPRGDGVAGPHARLGWLVLICAAAQIVGGALRGSKGGPTDPAADGSLRGDHYDMTRRRLVFEYLHKALGYLALALSVAAILTGLWQANAPVWMWAVLGLWWAAVVGIFATLQRRGLAADTYEAIWGPDARHPGNNRPVVGLGIRRRGDIGRR